MASPRKKQERVWEFDVTDPKLHPNGFTIYKVTCKVVIWKRYNDFKVLHKTLAGLHRNLHRREEFPEFAKPKLFGRFDETVIEERRLSALDLLKFVGRHFHLYRSVAFREFFKGGERQKHTDNGGKILRPVKLNLAQSNLPSTTQVDNLPSVPVSTNDDILIPQSVDVENAVRDEVPPSPELAVPAEVDVESDELSGLLWNLPQVPDNMSLNSFDGDDDPDLTDVESALSTPLPDADISFFDPLKSDALTPGSENVGSPELTHSNSWLMTAFQTCAGIEGIGSDEDQTPCNERPPDENDADTGTGVSFQIGQNNLVKENSEKGSNLSLEGATDSLTSSQRSTTSSIADSINSEFDPLKSRSHSKVECGKGDLDFSSRSPSVSSCGTPERKSSKPPSVTLSPSPRKQVRPAAAGSPRHRTETEESVSNIDLGGQYDYIYIAAHQISRAQESEVAGNYEMAHAYYMSGVGILLQGVQSDTNKARREAVKRKTAKYLMRVEDLGKRYMTNESLMSPDIELDPSLAYLKGPTSELKNFKVLGTVGKVLLVLDRSTDSTYVIKTLHKSEVTPVPRRPAIVPTSCPYMVQFYKFYETDNAIYMLLQYASGGKLWNYIGAYLQYNNGSGLKGGNQIYETKGSKNIYTGHKPSNEEFQETDMESHSDVISQSSNSQSEVGANVIENLQNAQVSSEKQDVHVNEKVTVKPDVSGLVVEKTSPDVCSSAYVALFSKDVTGENPADDRSAGVKFVSTKINAEDDQFRQVQQPANETKDSSQTHQTVARNCSLTSDDGELNMSQNTSSLSDKLSTSKDKFEDTLHSTKRSLDDFSIGSFDDGESFHRQDSGLSDHIPSIPEETSVFQSDLDTLEGDKQTNGDISNSEHLHELSEADIIVQNTKELLEAVDKSLQEDTTSCNSTPKLDCSDIPSSKLQEVNPSDLSIYDVNRSRESESSSPVKDVDKVSAESSNSSKRSLGTVLTNGYNSSEQFPPPSATSSEVPNSVIKQTSKERHRSSSGARKGTNIIRINSKEHWRSASFECDLKSPSKTRTRTISAVFEQLDMASRMNCEQVKIPENCIKHWAAEIVVCLNSLHSMGIVCRDLNPDNVLLGDRGHVLLTFFSQWSNTEQRVDQECVEQLYVAPEVRGITGYTEVCDWWSLGALLYELLVGKSLLSAHPGGVNSHTQLSLPPHLTPEASGLLDQLLCHNPRERLGSGITGVEEIKAHPFFSGIDWGSLTG